LSILEKETMNIFGKPLSAYFNFQKLILILILLVGVARLGLSLAGVSDDIVKWISITALSIVGIIYVGVKVPRTGFGSYKHLLPLFFIQAFLGNLFIVTGIAHTALTGRENIFSRPDYSGGLTPWQHALAHTIDGVIVGPLIGFLLGSIIMFVVKKISPAKSIPAVPA